MTVYNKATLGTPVPKKYYEEHYDVPDENGTSAQFRQNERFHLQSVESNGICCDLSQPCGYCQPTQRWFKWFNITDDLPVFSMFRSGVLFAGCKLRHRMERCHLLIFACDILAFVINFSPSSFSSFCCFTKHVIYTVPLC